MQKINDFEWVSECGEWTVFTDHNIRVYNLEERVDIESTNLPDEVQELLNKFETE
jgi:hypothetical protein